MDSIFSEEGEQQVKGGSKFWRRAQKPLTKTEIKGSFYEEANGEVVSTRDYSISGDHIFY